MTKETCTKKHRLCTTDTSQWCDAVQEAGVHWRCSRPKGHLGAHIACSPGLSSGAGHNIAQWKQSEAPAPAADTKDTNPKDAIGSDKLPLHLWPATATALGCLGLLDGMLKYGRTNWRVAGVRASIYIDACMRHVSKWDEGENLDEDSGLPHLGHALACLAILVDAQAAGKLNDDRMVEGGYLKFLKELTPHVARLKAKHAGRNPRHYTIKDNERSKS